MMREKPIANQQIIKRETMRAEYRFDYSKAKPNRFAAKMSKRTIAVVLHTAPWPHTLIYCKHHQHGLLWLRQFCSR